MPKLLVGNDRYRLRARRRGDLFCAPWCGCGCTWAQNRAAHAGAKVLSQRLGRGWTPRVWENGGWNFEAVSPCKRIKVSPNEFGGKTHSYTAYLGEAGSSDGQWDEHARTPEAAVRKVTATAKAALAKLHAVLIGL